MRKFISYMDECMPEEAIYPYEEDATVEESLRSVAKMAKWIQEFKRGFKEDVKLHVDLTGGMRSVNVMMLDVARLLEYSGVSRGHLLYSKYDPAKRSGTVEELGNIYELFQLISGAEEFVRFGSAKVLRDFYKERSKSDQLRRLLDAMEGFAEEIKLCHYGQLKDAIVELHDAVRDFDAEASEDVQELLLGRLVDRIREEYHQLIIPQDLDDYLDDLQVIRWCLKHGYMQQALTLYTERIPEYIGEHGLIRQTPEEEENLERLVALDTMGRNKWFYLLNECLPRTDRINKYCNKYFWFIKQDAMGLMKKKKFDMEAWWGRMEEFLEKNSLACEDRERLGAQLRLLASLHVDSSPLMTPEDSALDPIRPILAQLEQDMSAMDKGWQRLKRVDAFLQNEAKNEIMGEMMPMPYFCDDMVRQYPKAAKTHEMILDGIHTLQRYFERSAESQSQELLNLLAAMKNFSDGIRLCRTDAIRPIMADLRKCIEIFEGSGGKSSEEHIFLQLLQRVKDEYALVTQADASELDVIRWCMKKGHWQQAMTFATERLPIYIVDHHICEPVEGSGYEKKGDTSHHHWQQCFIVNARVPMPKVQKAQKKAKENLYLFFREALQGSRMQVEEDLKTLELLPEKFHHLVNEIKNADALLAEVRAHIGGFMNTPLRASMLNRLYPAEFMQKHCMFSRLLKFLYFSLGGDNMSYLHFLYKNVSRESILRGLLNCKMERCVEHDEIYLLVRLLQSEKEKRQPKSEKAERSQEEKWQEREAYWREAFARGVVRTKYPKKWEQVIHLLRAFERLRNERNRINHANDEQVEAPSMDVKLVEGMLNDCLEAIQDILPSSAPVRAL